MTMRVIVGAALPTVLLACAPSPKVDVLPTMQVGGVVQPEAIRYLEARVRLPEGAQPLEAYDRYYAIDRVGDRTVVHGVYLLRRSFGNIERGGMTPVEGRAGALRGDADDLPIVADGGCSVISVYFDTELYEFLMLQESGTDGPPTPALCTGLA
jgi:hypothetical protein